MKKTLLILLIVLITPMLYGESSTLMVQPPAHLQNFIVLPSGEPAIYFTRDQWIELSQLLLLDRAMVAEAAVKEAVIPLMVKIDALETRAARRRWIPIVGVTVGVVGVGVGVLLALVR